MPVTVVSGSTESILEVAVTLVASIIIEFSWTSTILVTSERCAQQITVLYTILGWR